MIKLIKWFSEGGRLNKKSVLLILQKFKSIYTEQPNLIDLNMEDYPKIHVIGDTHG